ncbi:MAG: c-type cytochrome [Dehalococcoidia bacterium]|nr:c-type cytochrome [Dehalococcoidia bacterium]
MNTSKQVNAMIGLLGLLVIILGAYAINEGSRQASAREEILERNITRGAKMFVNNCRGCHGMDGNGTDDGAIAPPLRQDAFLIIPEHDEQFQPTPAGEAEKLRTFLKNTIACGRTGSPMPTWSERYGGPLSDTKIDQLVILLTTPGAWEIYDEIQNEHFTEVLPAIHDRDAAYAKDKDATVVKIKDVATLSLTESNCGQYAGVAASEFRLRQPLVAKGMETKGGTGEATPKAKASGPLVKGLPVADFFKANCAVCHGATRQGGVGPALNPTRLTQPDEFYIDAITNGRPGTAMPSWKAQGLSEDDIRNLLQFEKYTKP